MTTDPARPRAPVETLAQLPGRILRGLRSRAFRTTTSTWFNRSLDDIPPPAAPTEGYTVDFLTDNKSRLVEWLRLHHERFPWIYVPEELEIADPEGHLYVIVRRDADIVGYVKLGVNRVYIHDFRRIVRFPAPDCFVYDTFVHPNHRGQRLAEVALAAGMQHMRDRGNRRIWCHIESWNEASLRLFGRMGFTPVAGVRFARILGIPFFVRDGRVPFQRLEGFLARTHPNP